MRVLFAVLAVCLLLTGIAFVGTAGVDFVVNGRSQGVVGGFFGLLMIIGSVRLWRYRRRYPPEKR